MEQARSAVLPAKLTAPTTSKAVPRNRLFKQLDEALEKPVIWIGAPAGSGKTTLVASYLVARKIKPLWYQLDARDADPAAFFAYLRQAAGKLAPRKRESLPLLTPEYGMGLPVFTLNFFDQLFSRLRSPVVLVFDNFQNLPESSPLHKLLEPLLAALPESVTLIFLSRSQAPPGFAGIAAAQRLARIDAESLLLTPEEAGAISRQIVPEIRDPDEIRALNQRAGGWAAGLILLLEGAGSSDDLVADSDLFNYFAAEVMRRSDVETQKFLTASALLPVMDDRSTERLTGNHGAKELLRELTRRNYFITHLAGSPVRYEFHPLFRTFLLAELERSRSASELRLLQYEAGRILSEQGEYSAAIELLDQAEAQDELRALVLTLAAHLVMEGQYATLQQWLQRIPEFEFADQPWLYYWRAVSLMPFSPLQSRECFERAYREFECREDIEGLYLSWVGIAENYSMMWDDFSTMESWLEEYAALHSRYPNALLPQLEIRVLAALFGVLIYLRPHHSDCRETHRMLEEKLHLIDDSEFKLRVVINVSIYYMWRGDIASALRISDQLGEALSTEVASPVLRIYLLVLRSNLCWLTGDTQGASETVANALILSETSGIYFMRAVLMSQRIFAYGIDNQIETMGHALTELYGCLSPERRLDYSLYLHQQSWYSRLLGEYVQALSQERKALELAQQMSTPLPITLCQIGLATNLIHLDEYTEAHEVLDEVLEFAIKMQNPLIETEARLVRAFAWFRQGNEENCAIELERGFQLGSDSNYLVSQHLMERRILSLLCEFSLARNIKPDYARLLIRKWSLQPEHVELSSDRWPWPVRIYTLGTFSIEVDNSPFKFSRKRRNRVIELLVGLITLGRRDVSEQRISDLIWPDAEGDLARQNLKVTLHRLRKLIGQESVLMIEGRLSLDSGRIWVDSWSVDRLLGRIEGASDDQLPVLITEVIERYGEGFMQGDDTSWVVSERERLRGRFLRIIHQAAERLCHKQQWQIAIDCYNKALEVDPLAERFHIGLMRSHHALGQAAEGLIAYHRCQEILTNRLKIQPSKETEVWYERLRTLA